MTKTRGAGTRDPKGIREELRRMVREEVNGSRETSDEELYEIIDRLILQKGDVGQEDAGGKGVELV